MATQGIVSICRKGNVLFKVVAGSNGANAEKLIDWARTHQGNMTAAEIYQAAKEVRFGADWDLVVQASDGTLAFNDDEIHGEDLGRLYRDTQKFGDPYFNPRWKSGLADYVRVLEMTQ